MDVPFNAPLFESRPEAMALLEQEAGFVGGVHVAALLELVVLGLWCMNVHTDMAVFNNPNTVLITIIANVNFFKLAKIRAQSSVMQYAHTGIYAHAIMQL